jgi:hypothetical protein
VRLRTLAIGTLALSLAGPGTAAMAAKPKPKPKPVCNLITDPSGDGHASVAGAVLNSPALDILSGDIASGPKTVVGVLRVTTTNTANDNVAALGMKWALNFAVAGKDYAFTVSKSSGTATPVAKLTGAPDGTAVTLKVDAGSYTWSVPRAAFTGLKPKSSVFTVKSASSFVYTFNADAASAMKPYLDQTLSCVKAG